jgi:diguanylate cyclase (GGDEF)-like protein/PAS domain S-box-containing protein
VTAEEKLRASEAILSLAMDVAGLAPWDYDPSSEEFIFNDRFYSLYATDAQREGGYRIQTLDYVERFIHPDDRVMVEALTVCLPSGERNPNFAPYMEHRTVLPSGAERWVSVYTNAVFDPSGKLESMHGVNQDISERKRAEVAMQIANEKLVQQLDTIEQLQERLRDQAVHDALTELYNRHYLSEALAPEIIRSEREKTPLSVVIADVDHFKVINDTYGHPVGDLFLVEIADLMKKYVRGSDFVCRYGGEEFLLVFPGTTMRSAMKRAEEICQKCAEIVIQHEGKRLNVTLSFGVATYPEDGKTAEKVILRADQALYQSKHAGRNQVTGWINGQLTVHPENNEPQ